jgi:hypothetical protein
VSVATARDAVLSIPSTLPTELVALVEAKGHIVGFYGITLSLPTFKHTLQKFTRRMQVAGLDFYRVTGH